MALRISELNAIKQLVCCYYRGGLTKSLQDKLRRLGEIEVFYRDEDYNGFNGYEFVPDAEVYSLFLWIFKGKELSLHT